MPQPIDSSSYRSPQSQRPAVPLPIEREPRAHDPYAAFRFGDFSLFTGGNLLSITGRLMLAVAVEWEIYGLTHSATALGLVGLVIVVPVVTLSLPAGHLADRFSRKHIILVSQIFSALASAALAIVSWRHLSIPPIALLRGGNRVLTGIAAIFERHHPAFHFDDTSIPLIYLLLFIGATARTFSWAARSSFFPTLVPRDVFANAVTWNNSIFQIGSVVGPALSGLLVAYVGLFPFGCSNPPQQAKARSDRGKYLEKSHGRPSICLSEKGDPGNNHPGFVRGTAWRRDRAAADFRRSNPALRTGGAGLDASDARGWRLLYGACGRTSPADETSRQSPAVVRYGVRDRDNSFRLIQNILAIARLAMSRRCVRQRERDHSRLDCAAGHAG